MKINITFIIITILIGITLVGIYLRKLYVDLELIAVVKNENISINNENKCFDSEWHWICIDSNDRFIKKEDLESWGIDLESLGIDFYKNNVVLAFSREIKQMKFRKKDLFRYRSGYPVMTVMSKEFESNTIYVYKIPKYYVVDDVKAKINIETTDD